MNRYKKNRIWKKLSAMGMAFLVTGMVCGSGVQGTVYAQSDASVYETVESIRAEAGQQEYSLEETAETPDDEGTRNTEFTESAAENMEIQDTWKDELRSEYGSAGETEEPEDEKSENDTAAEEANGDDSSLSDGPSEEDDITDHEEGSDDNNSNDEKVAAKPDFALTVSAEEEQIKAGQDLVYTVTLENTGNVMLKNIQMHTAFTQEDLSGEWSGDNLEQLDVGMKKVLYLTVKIPEGQDKNVTLHLSVSAETVAEDGEKSTSIMQETSLDTEVTPLKASFEVTKTADHSIAAPGDKILFKICIRNTGERTLHSVITTERFQLGNVPVQFLDKDGVVLNKAKTKARIDKIEPGRAAGLQAMVTLPENIKEQDLLNEVTVTTLETGDQTVASQAKIQVKAVSETKEDSSDSVDKDTADGNSGAVSHTGQSYSASTHPKTGDPYQPFLWLAMIPGSLLAAGWCRSRMLK